MRAHKGSSEPRRTAAAETFPPSLTEVEAFQRHDRLTVEFTDALRSGRCRKTDRFAGHLGETMGVLEPLVGRWNLEIVFLLYMQGGLRFAALKRALDGVSSRVLTDKLRHLEAASLVAREDREGAVAYSLTPQGLVVARHLHPIVFYLRNVALVPPP